MGKSRIMNREEKRCKENKRRIKRKEKKNKKKSIEEGLS